MTSTPPFETFLATDGESFRRLARTQAASVTVVTFSRAPERVGPGSPRLDGFTATAFLTVSLDPPIVLVSATNASSAARMFRDADAFAVNVLAAPQRPVADLFATAHELRDDPFAGVPWTPDGAGVPLLTGALGAYSARVRELILAGDHTLALGDVTALHLGAAAEPLVYHNRRYGRVTSEP